MQEGSLFSKPSPAFITCSFFDDGHFDQCELMSHCSFDLHFSNVEHCWAHFHVFMSHLYVFFEEIYLAIFPTFCWVVCFSGTDLYELLIYFRNQSFVSSFTCYYSLPFWGLSFQLVYSFLSFKFNLVHLFLSLFIFPLLSEVGHRGSCCDFCHRMFCLCSSKSFIVSCLTFKAFIHFEFIFVYGVRKCCNFILLHVAVQFTQHHLLKKWFAPLYSLASFVKNKEPIDVSVYLGALSLAPLAYISVFVPVPHFLDDYSFRL